MKAFQRIVLIALLLVSPVLGQRGSGTELANPITAGTRTGLVIQGKYLYSVDNVGDTLDVYDISDPRTG